MMTARHTRGPAQARTQSLARSQAQAGLWPRPGLAQARPKPGLACQILGSNKIKTRKMKFSRSKSVLAQMLARSGLVAKKNIRAPFGAIPEQFFHGPKNVNMLMFNPCSFVVLWLPFTRFGPMAAGTWAFLHFFKFFLGPRDGQSLCKGSTPGE